MTFITVSVDTVEVIAWARELFQDQIPYATAKAINATALDFQRVQRRHQEEIFTIRRKQFFDRAVKISTFARKDSPTAVVGIDPPGGQSRADVITQHEEGGTKLPEGKSLTIPDAAKRTQGGGGIIRKRDRPRAYDFKRVSTRGATEVMKGNRRTFLIRNADGSGVIRQRTGPGEFGTFKGTVVLFRLTPKGAIEPVLDFYENAEKTVDDVFGDHFVREFYKAAGATI